MSPSRTCKFIALLSTLSLLAITCTLPLPQLDEPGVLSAILSEVQGEVQARRNDSTELQPAADGQFIEQNGQVLTLADSRARLDLSDGTIIRVGPLSVYTLEGVEETPDGLVSRWLLDGGTLWVILRGGLLEVRTPSGVAAVSGSFMHVVVDFATGAAEISCLEGDCSVTTNAGTLSLVAGQKGILTSITEPPQMEIMTDEEVQRWIDQNPEAMSIIPVLTLTAATYIEVESIIQLPEMACIEDDSCAEYCAPPGWDPLSLEIPDIEQIPQDCIDAAIALADQGVALEQLLACVLLGGDFQGCADAAYVTPTPEP